MMWCSTGCSYPRHTPCAFGPGMTPQGRHYQSPLYRYVLLRVIRAADKCRGAGHRSRGSGRVSGVGANEASRPGRPNSSCGNSRCSRSGWRKQWRWCAQRGRGCTPRCSRLGGRCGPADTSHLPSAADLLLAAANATRSAAAAVDILYTLAGATANYRRSPLQRALRDIHAATQHMGTAPQQYESA